MYQLKRPVSEEATTKSSEACPLPTDAIHSAQSQKRTRAEMEMTPLSSETILPPTLLENEDLWAQIDVLLLMNPRSSEQELTLHELLTKHELLNPLNSQGDLSSP